MATSSGDKPPSIATDAVLVKSEAIPEGTPIIKGYEFSDDGKVDLDALLGSMLNTGFQATSFGQAMERTNEMLTWRLSDEPFNPATEQDDWKDPARRANTRCKIFLGFTSNLISSGVREGLKFLCKHKMIDVLVTTAGGVEEDFIKCLKPTFMGDFALRGKDLRARGLNRIGNMLVPNDNYCAFEDWLMPILDKMVEEQTSKGTKWTPSRFIQRLGEEINDEDSVYYWCAKNGIPVYCPALTDGSIGDMIYFHSYKNPGLVIDIVEDIRAMNNEATRINVPRRTGILLMGGGLPKHHIHNANLMRNGADYAVILNTAQEFDGSDSGARPDEAISWGKIRVDAKPVKVYGDATILFPLLVAQSFAKQLHNLKGTTWE